MKNLILIIGCGLAISIASCAYASPPVTVVDDVGEELSFTFEQVHFEHAYYAESDFAFTCAPAPDQPSSPQEITFAIYTDFGKPSADWRWRVPDQTSKKVYKDNYSRLSKNSLNAFRERIRRINRYHRLE